MLQGDIDIERIMGKLSEEYGIFTSEADFQFSMAWVIKESYPECRIRLEEVFPWDPDKHFDIVVHTDKGVIPIELKYCTKRLPIGAHCDVVLKNQGAEDLRRYDFIKDVQRVESVRGHLKKDDQMKFVCGYAILLTNSSLFWKSSRDYQKCCDHDFRIHEDKGRFGGRMSWDGASEGTMKGREESLRTDEYKIIWKDYLDEPKFRYLPIRIG